MTTTQLTQHDAEASRKAALRAQRRGRWSRRAPLLPALLFTIVVTQVPFAITLWISFHNWEFLRPGSFEWIGVQNYRDLWSNEFFREAVWNTFLMTFGTVFISTVIAIILAVLLDRKFFGQGIVRTLLITPFLIMPVAASLVWRNGFLDVTYGFLNWGNELLGREAVGYASAAPLGSVMLVLVWQWTPFIMLILLAGLQSQDTSVLEAAKVDGASPTATFFQITLPHLRRYIDLGALLSSIYLLQTFDLVDQLVGGASGARNVPYFVYQRSIGGGWRFGEASTFGVLVVIASIILANVALRVISNLLEGEDVA